MGHSCRKRNVMLLLAALEEILTAEGHACPAGAAGRAAARVYAEG